MDWKKLITALSAVASALSGAEALLHAVGLPTEVAAGASLVFLVLTAVGRSVWPERKPAGGNGPGGGLSTGIRSGDSLASREPPSLWGSDAAPRSFVDGFAVTAVTCVMLASLMLLAGCGGRGLCRLSSEGIKAAALAGSQPQCDDECRQKALRAIDSFEWLGERNCPAGGE